MKFSSSPHGIPQRQSGRTGVLAVVTLALAMGLAWLLLSSNTSNPLSSLFGSIGSRGLQPALFQTAPLRTTRGGVDRVYAMSTQSQTVRFRSGRSISEVRNDYLHIDLWAIDSATTTIAWRRRLRTFEGKEGEGRILPGFAILGADGDTLWLNVEGPLGVSLIDGHTIADVALIEQRNPDLAGKLVLETGYVAFGKNGLQLTLDDGNQWRIDARDLSAAPRNTPISHPSDIVGLADFGNSATSRFQLRALAVENAWLGVLTDAEASERSHPAVVPGREPNERPGALQQFLNENHIPKPLNDLLPQAYRLWKAQVTRVSAAPPDWPRELPDNWGTREEFTDYDALPQSPTFLRGGLLRENGSAKVPLWYSNPDSVLVLHLDKLGPAGRLQLSRISGPLGKPVWKAPLAMVTLATVLRGESDLMLWGSEPLSSDRSQQSRFDEHRKLVRIDVASGQSSVLDLTAVSITTPAGNDAPSH
ncbi:MAG: PA2928 family protein [Dokdonella sp.]